ncbi:unnamed protein product, partial [Effrenium voratum]
SRSSSRPSTQICTELPDEDLSRFDKIFVLASGDDSSRAIQVLAACLEVMKSQTQAPEL